MPFNSYVAVIPSVRAFLISVMRLLSLKSDKEMDESRF